MDGATAVSLRERLHSGLRLLLEGIVLTLVVALTTVVVVGVVFRKAGASLVWYDEVASILLAWLTYYGAALAALHRAHIGVPTLVERAPPALRTPMVLVAETAVAAFFVVLAAAGVRVLAVLHGSTLVSLPWVPAAVAQSAIPVGAVLFLVAQALTLPEALRRPRDGGHDGPAAPATPAASAPPAPSAGAEPVP